MNTPMTTPMSEMNDLQESVREPMKRLREFTRFTINGKTYGHTDFDVIESELLRLAARVKELESYAKEADRRVGEQFNCAQQAQAFTPEKQRECLSATTELAALENPNG